MNSINHFYSIAFINISKELKKNQKLLQKLNNISYFLMFFKIKENSK
jgi:hypothetical protein